MVDEQPTNANSRYSDVIEVESIGNDQRVGNSGDASGWGSVQYQSGA
jgi:hypothetical protein